MSAVGGIRAAQLFILAGIVISIFVGRQYCFNIKSQDGNWTADWQCGDYIDPSTWVDGDIRAQIYVAIAAFLLVLIFVGLIIIDAVDRRIKLCEIFALLFCIMNFIAMGVLEAWMSSGKIRYRGDKRWVYVECYVAACVLCFFGLALALIDIMVTAMTNTRTVVREDRTVVREEVGMGPSQVKKDVY